MAAAEPLRGASVVVGQGQGLVEDTQHVDVVQQDLRGVLGVEGDVGDGRVPLQPELVQPAVLHRAAPGRVLLLGDAELKELLVRVGDKKVVGGWVDGEGRHRAAVGGHRAVVLEVFQAVDVHLPVPADRSQPVPISARRQQVDSFPGPCGRAQRVQVFAAPRFQQLHHVDRASVGGDEESARVGSALQLVGWEQQLGHARDLLDADAVALVLHAVEVEARGSAVGNPAATG